MWAGVLLTALGCYLLKLAGLTVPERVLDRPVVRRVADLIPVALLAALMAVEIVGSERAVVVDARLAGLAAGIAALLLKAPFLVVIGVAAATAALVRVM